MYNEDGIIYESQYNETLFLGLIMSDKNYYLALRDKIQPAMFSTEKTSAVYKAILEIEKDGKEIDIVAISNKIGELIPSDQLVGWIQEAGVAFINADSILNALQLGMKKRKLMDMARSLSSVIGDNVLSADQIDANVVRLYEDFMSQSNIKSDLEHISKSVDRIYTKQTENLDEEQIKIAGIPTGFKIIDDEIGGLQKGNLVIIGGSTSVGKTAFALNIAQNVAEKGYKILVVSLEMIADENTVRFISAYSGLAANKVIFPKAWEEAGKSGRIGDINEKVSNFNLHYLTAESSSNITVEKIRAHVMSLKATQGLDLVIVDYLQLVDDGNPRRGKSDAEKLEDITKSLKRMAMSQGVPVIALAQLNRDTNKSANGKPQLWHFKGSSSIEQTANIALLLHRNKTNTDGEEGESYFDNTLKEDETRVYIAKNRNGMSGTSVKFKFNKLITTFYETN